MAEAPHPDDPHERGARAGGSAAPRLGPDGDGPGRRLADALADATGTPRLRGDEVAALLDAARDAAHGTERWAAPVACYLAGRAGLDAAAAAGLVARLAAGAADGHGAGVGDG
ncbi:MAG: DUF6457 domain-containing protein [Actinomycetes bacterium]